MLRARYPPPERCYSAAPPAGGLQRGGVAPGRRDGARRLGAVSVFPAVVAHDLRHADAIAGEQLAAATGLRLLVAQVLAPAQDRRLVPPERDRDELAGVVDALEPLHRDKAVDLLQIAAQPGREVEILLRPAVARLDLEDYRDHRSPPPPAAVGAA